MNVPNLSINKDVAKNKDKAEESLEKQKIIQE
jgi:hypothetical protein